MSYWADYPGALAERRTGNTKFARLCPLLKWLEGYWDNNNIGFLRFLKVLEICHRVLKTLEIT